MSSPARHHTEHPDTQPRVLLAGRAVELEQLGDALLSRGLGVSVARSEEDLLQLLAAVELGSMLEPDAIILEARLLGPPSLRALRSLRLERPRVALVFIAGPDDRPEGRADRVSRVIAAHLGGSVASRPVLAEDVCAVAGEAAMERTRNTDDHDHGPPSGVRKNSGTPDRGKDHARS